MHKTKWQDNHTIPNYPWCSIRSAEYIIFRIGVLKKTKSLTGNLDRMRTHKEDSFPRFHQESITCCEVCFHQVDFIHNEFFHITEVGGDVRKSDRIQTDDHCAVTKITRKYHFIRLTHGVLYIISISAVSICFSSGVLPLPPFSASSLFLRLPYGTARDRGNLNFHCTRRMKLCASVPKAHSQVINLLQSWRQPPSDEASVNL